MTENGRAREKRPRAEDKHVVIIISYLTRHAIPCTKRYTSRVSENPSRVLKNKTLFRIRYSCSGRTDVKLECLNRNGRDGLDDLKGSGVNYCSRFIVIVKLSTRLIATRYFLSFNGTASANGPCKSLM